jgi:dihydrofolate reductase
MTLIYSAITSLDGYVADQNGKWDWSIPDEEVHAAVNDLERPVGTYLLGRRMYEVLAAWETMPTDGQPPTIADYAAIWKATDKVVYSTTLTSVSTARTRIEPAFDAGAVKELVADADTDVSVGGPGLAAHALRAGLVGEIRLFVSPIAVGGGTAVWPADLVLPLRRLETREFGNGATLLRYAVTA